MQLKRFTFFRDGRARDFGGMFRRIAGPLDYEEGARMAPRAVAVGRDALDYSESMRGARPRGFVGFARAAAGAIEEGAAIARTAAQVGRVAAGIGRSLMFKYTSFVVP